MVCICYEHRLPMSFLSWGGFKMRVSVRSFVCSSDSLFWDRQPRLLEGRHHRLLLVRLDVGVVYVARGLLLYQGTSQGMTAAEVGRT